MLFDQAKSSSLPTVVLLHGGGLSSWSVNPIKALLETNFQVITPIIDGHGEDYAETFISIEDSTKKLIAHIDEQHNGQVFAMCGLSLRAQIVIEVLSQRNDITENALIESPLAIPMKAIEISAAPTYNVFFGLIKHTWFSRLQARSLLIPDALFDDYYHDTKRMTKESLINIAKSNASYDIKGAFQDTHARVSVIVGDKERAIMKKSASKIHEHIKSSNLHIMAGMKHGELSIGNPERYFDIFMRDFINTKAI